MDKIITVLGYKYFITEMSDAPDCSETSCRHILQFSVIIKKYLETGLVTILRC